MKEGGTCMGDASYAASGNQNKCRRGVVETLIQIWNADLQARMKRRYRDERKRGRKGREVGVL
jgi:hypothetical protein